MGKAAAWPYSWVVCIRILMCAYLLCWGIWGWRALGGNVPNKRRSHESRLVKKKQGNKGQYQCRNCSLTLQRTGMCFCLKSKSTVLDAVSLSPRVKLENNQRETRKVENHYQQNWNDIWRISGTSALSSTCRKTYGLLAFVYFSAICAARCTHL